MPEKLSFSTLLTPVEANPKARPTIAALALLLYFPLLIATHSLLGNLALAIVFVPALVWSVVLSPRLALTATLLLAIPNYYIFIALEAMQTPLETIQLFGSHTVIGAVAYIVGYGYFLRRKLSEELAARQKSDARFRGLFENTSDAVFFLSPDLTILDLNNQAALMLGYTAAELVGMDYRMVVVPGEQDDLAGRMQDVLAGKMLPRYERKFRCKDGTVLSADVNASLIYDRHGAVYHVQSICRDITERKAAEEQLFHKATHDDLTGLFNRAMLFTLLGQAVEVARRQDHKLAVLFLDLDGFKAVNDTYGHAQGDLMLKHCADRLRSRLRTSDVVARVGGDEFAVILTPVADRTFATQVADSIEQTLSAPFDLDGQRVQIFVSVGVSMFPDEKQDAENLMKLADQNMYAVKQKRAGLGTA